ILAKLGTGYLPTKTSAGPTSGPFQNHNPDCRLQTTDSRLQTEAMTTVLVQHLFLTTDPLFDSHLALRDDGDP
ncbi:hypothetical protein E4U54_005937, partial [Claviceps lovelessii]